VTDFARAVGSALAKPIEIITKLIAVITRLSTGVIRGFRSMQAHLTPALDAIGEAIDKVRANWRYLFGATEEASQAMSASTDDWVSAGEIIGQVLGGIATAIGYVVAAIAEAVSAIIWFVGGVRDLFVAVGTWIGESVAKVVLFFTEDIPAALDVAWSKVTGFFTGIGDFFVSIGAWFKGLFSSIATTIKNFFSPVVEFFDQVRRGIQKVIDAIAGAVKWLTAKVPGMLLPDSLMMTRTLIQNQQASVAPHQAGNIGAGSPGTVMPATIEAKARSTETKELERSIAALAETGDRKTNQPMTFNLQVDSETIARAARQADEESAGRGFSPIPVY
jgi:hypothetical protein